MTGKMNWVCRSAAVLSVYAACAAMFALPASAKPPVVRVYNWSDYIDPEILADFKKETGIEVVYDVYDSNDVLESKLLAGGSGYDVVVPGNSFLSKQIEAGLFRKLDKAKIPNLRYMWPDIAGRVGAFDPGNLYSVDYMWGTIGIGYNEAKIKERMPDAPVNSWDMVFKSDVVSKFKDCGVYFLDAPNDIIPAVLKYLGLDPNSINPDDIDKATRLLISIRQNVKKFHSSEYINALAKGDICLAIGASGDIKQAASRANQAKNNQTIRYSIPKEGAQLWFDLFAIPADAKNADEAHAFINYMMRPEVIAKATNYVSYANGNLASLPFVTDAVKTDPSIYPDEETMKRLYVKLAYDTKTRRVVTRSWTKVLTSH